MWQKLVGFLRGAVTFGREMAQLSDDVSELRQENDRLSANLHLLAVEHQRVLGELARMHDAIQNERENSQLRLGNELLKFERRLLPAS